jgi:hypothetical protein
MDSASLAEYGLEAMDSYNSSDHSPRVLDIKIPADVEIGEAVVPKNIKISAPYPNPFNPQTAIQIELNENMHLYAAVFDINGRVVKQLINGYLQKGNHEITFNNKGLTSGIYFIRIEGEGIQHTSKVVLLK